MGSVKLETRNEGRGLREWDYLPLSEPRIVAQLIKNRSKQDESYYALLEETDNPVISNGVFPFSEPVLCSCIDLDILINHAGLSKQEAKIVHWTMQGYAQPDIGEHCGCGTKKVSLLQENAVRKICEENNRRWAEANRTKVNEVNAKANSKFRCNTIEGEGVFYGAL